MYNISRIRCCYSHIKLNNKEYVRYFAVPGRTTESKPKGKVIGKKDSTEERKMLSAMEQLAFASDKAAKYVYRTKNM